MSELTYWSFPTRVVFGNESIRSIGIEAAALGASSALIVTDAGVRSAGLAEPIEAALSIEKIRSTVFSEISSNPVEDEVLQAANAFKNANADLVIGLGGGSPLDVAKLVRLAATHPLPLAQYDDAKGGDVLIKNALPPMIAVPTTAGTGSEVGRSGVVTIAKTKTVIFAPSLMPNVALLDPSMTVSMPASITAATGMDALTHCIEAYCALGDHPMADAMALHGIALCERSLEKACLDGTDLQARGDMLKAAMLGAVAFQKGLGACHSLAHPLSSHHDLHHGLANALCLPAVVDFNRSAVPEKIATIARALGLKANTEAEATSSCADAIASLRLSIGLPSGLSECKIEKGHLEELSLLATQDACHAFNPRACSKSDMLALYRASL